MPPPSTPASVGRLPSLLQRTKWLLWHAKWLFASCAVAFALFMLAAVVTMPLLGFAFSDWWFTQTGTLAMVATAIVVSPLVYKHLR